MLAVILAVVLSIATAGLASAQTIVFDGRYLSCCVTTEIAVPELQCDSVDRTPRETLECKRKYWEQRVKEIQAEKAELQNELGHAMDREQAFAKAEQ